MRKLYCQSVNSLYLVFFANYGVNFTRNVSLTSHADAHQTTQLQFNNPISTPAQH